MNKSNSLGILVGVALIIAGVAYWYLAQSTPVSAPVAATPASKDDLIVVNTPLPNTEIESPLLIQGKARGNWYFEASFPVSLYDEAGNQLGIMPVQADGEWMTTDYVPFSEQFTFATSTTSTGTLVFKKDNASGLPEHDNELRIPVRFKTTK